MHDAKALPDGLYSDLVTPFRDGAFDGVGFAGLIEWHMRGGVSGIVVCGEAGEAPTLSRQERAEIIRIAVDVAANEVPVLVGVGTNCTRTTVELALEAKTLGAHAAVAVLPYYSKPTQEGVLHHFRSVSDAVDMPLLIANAPARTAIDLGPDLMERLADLPNIAGIVDYTGDLSRRGTFPAACSQQIRHYSGHDLTALPFCLMGGRGVLSIAANAAPRLFASMYHAQQNGNISAATTLNRRLMPLVLALEREHAVVAAKLALSCLLGLTTEVRLPLLPLDPATEEAVRNALSMVGDQHRPLRLRA